MAKFTKDFVNPYPGGWKDDPNHDTPITADALQRHTNAIEHIEDYLVDNPSGGGGAEIDYGTQAQFDSVKASLPEGASYYVTDDYDESGFGIDTSNLLATLTSQGASYTATQNCYAIVTISSSSGGFAPQVYIDNVVVLSVSTGFTLVTNIPIAKGQTISTRANYGNYDVKIYATR